MSEAVRTAGIESAVCDDEHEPIGHVVMLDYDSVSRQAMLSDVRAIDGPTVVLQSSAGCWHAYGLCVVSWQEATETARQSRASTEYVTEMERRGMSTLRIGAKGDKPAPTVRFVHAPDRDDAVAVSRPHLGVLKGLATGELKLCLEAIQAGLHPAYDPVGETVGQSVYETGAV